METAASRAPYNSAEPLSDTDPRTTRLEERDHLALRLYPYKPLDEWATECSQRKLNRGEDLDDIYVASHTWTTKTVEHETFGRPLNEEGASELGTFLSRNRGSWSNDPDKRVAVWHEIIGSVRDVDDTEVPTSLFQESTRLAIAMSKYLGLPDVMLTPRRRAVSFSSYVIEFGYLIYVVLGYARVHIFLLDNNEIVTVCPDPYAQALSFDREIASLFVREMDSLRTGANAAALLGRIMTCVTSNHSQRLDPIVLKDAVERAWDKYGNKAIPHLTLDERICPRELQEVCLTLLDMRSRQPWLDNDVQVYLERAYLEVKDVMGEMEVYTAQADVLNNQHQLALAEVAKQQVKAELKRTEMETRRANERARLDAERAEIHRQVAERQAQSAASLNQILAALTAVTILTLPFMMTAAYYSMQIPGSNPTYQKFWTTVGAVTGPLSVIYILSGLYLHLRSRQRRQALEDRSRILPVSNVEAILNHQGVEVQRGQSTPAVAGTTRVRSGALSRQTYDEEQDIGGHA